MRIPPLHRRRGAREDGPVGVDKEPLDGHQEGFDETGFHWLGPGALPSALTSAERRSCMENCSTWAHAPSGTQGTWRPTTA